MPYVLQHKTSQQIFTCTQVNHYGLAYYGVKFWPDLETAEQQFPAFLHNIGGMETDAWHVTELEEGEMKLCNVKLKNDPNLQVFWPLTRKPEVRKPEK
ncbi:hypothetical protein [Paenibacillus sp. Root444D2]|uniref:hypothetical protein n=1 Tax=Paenibacillus sp. Root444D2 TaxID=1736538 RepID=UPI00070B1C6D|nr:hypothetical protein [Paenibacillus sp. Root444D2]KQX69104.1 hypothetical protein ASD40_00985 [Paenibacillus sp. Root444D2]